MKKKILFTITILMILLLLSNVTQTAVYAQDLVTTKTFYDALLPYGHWLTIYGGVTVWHPVFVNENWHPYTEGRWTWTQWGWYWVSDEPFGWIVYHYGRWYYDNFYGWIWFPDNEWGPAWVEWRSDDEVIGWAPMPPFGIIHVTIYEQHFHSYSPERYWCFIPYEHFSRHIHHSSIHWDETDHHYKHSTPPEVGKEKSNSKVHYGFAPEFIKQRSSGGTRTTNTQTGRTFGSQRGKDNSYNSDFSGQNNRRSNESFDQQNSQEQERKTEQAPRNSGGQRQSTSPRVTQPERSPRELRQELMERYERTKPTQPPARENTEKQDQSDSEEHRDRQSQPSRRR